MFRHLLSVTLGSALAILNIGPAAADTKAISRRAQVSRTAHVNGTELHYLSAGSGPITVVLIHGFAESSYEWRKVMPRLSETYRVIAVDLRGGGGSAPTPGPIPRLLPMLSAAAAHGASAAGLHRPLYCWPLQPDRFLTRSPDRPTKAVRNPLRTQSSGRLNSEMHFRLRC